MGPSSHLNALNQLLDDSAYKYLYDANGNMIEKSNGTEKICFKYDALDRLLSIENSNLLVTYNYDAQNRRLNKSIQKRKDSSVEWGEPEVIRFLYLGQNEVGTYDSRGKALELRVLGLGKGAEIGAAMALELQGAVYAPVHDHNGNAPLS